MFVVACSSRHDHHVTLFLVDRKKCKTRWWSDTLDDAIKFQKKEAAEVQCKKLSKNYPRVMNFVDALKAEALNDETAFTKEGDLDYEEGWDAHKDSW